MKKHYSTHGNPNEHGWDVCDDDGRLLGVYVGRMVATARFSSPEDAAECDRLIRFLFVNLAGCTLGDGEDRATWEPGKRPASEPLAPPLAEAFAQELSRSAAEPQSGVAQKSRKFEQ